MEAARMNLLNRAPRSARDVTENSERKEEQEPERAKERVESDGGQNASNVRLGSCAVFTKV